MVLLVEDRLQVDRRVVVQPGEELRVHAGDARRRVAESFAVGILADGLEDGPDGGADAFLVDHGARSSRRGGGSDQAAIPASARPRRDRPVLPDGTREE